MEEDEEGTLAALNAHRSETIEPYIAENRGRVVKTTGDGFLAEFASVVDAVHAALAIQRSMNERNADASANSRIDFRVGVNLGDVIVDGDDLYGEGVNVAARLEGLCEPRGILVSANVYDQVEGKLPAVFSDIGNKTLKNITKPVRVYRVEVESEGDAESDPNRRAKPGLPDKPSVAILPFDNMSGDPGQDFFAEGIADDIITELSRYDELFVISRHSAFAYRGRDVGVSEIAAELGVKFVVEGSVRRAENRVRVTAQLIDALTQNHIWAERYDRDLDDIFAVQDEITAVIVNTLAGQITHQHHQHALAKSPIATDAYDHVLRAMMLIYRLSPEANLQAGNEAQLAIEIDPKYARAYALLAWSYEMGAVLRWVNDPAKSVSLALDAAANAVALDEMDPWGHAALGHILIWGRKAHERGIAAFERAVSLNPNNAHFLSWYSVGLCFSGRPDDALRELDRAMRLNPHYPPLYLNFLGRILLTMQRYREALPYLERLIVAMPQNPSGLALAAACYAALDKLEDAKNTVDQIIADSPRYCIKDLHLSAPYRGSTEMERFENLLRKAGLPESAPTHRQ